MPAPTTATDHLTPIDLAALAQAGTTPGAAWTHQGDDLNVNLLVFPAGDGMREHVNTEVDVLVVGIAGDGEIRIDDQAYAMTPGRALVIPKGSRRASAAIGERFAYLSCHRRRTGLWPSVGASGST